MKKMIICFSSILLLLFSATLLFASDNALIETKDTIVRDAKAIKEQVPNDISETKKEFIKKSNEVKTSAAQELKDIQEGLSNPIKKSAPDTETK